ncbi:fatty-acid amide hydrolase 2-B-like [Centruroides vittatus]|uniref:fatty-acid amide hydrolase 2-B-like n=1 Tax=Centruroides vittatus TaxID=120091 RepID=UPI00350FBA21
MELVTTFTPIVMFILRIIRTILDYFTNIIFGLIYLRNTERIECVKNPLLLESASSLAEKIRKKKVKSVDVVNAYIARIKEIQPILNVIVESRFENALEDARKVDQMLASREFSEEELQRRFPFLGVPFSCKESLAVKGMHHTAGLYSNKDNRASENSEVVALLKKAGAIPLVTTNVCELCLTWETSNKIYGRTRNPYNVKRIAGGSTGGEGGLLGAGGSIIGVGSDLAGSIRIPAFFNGVFGHKPSRDIVSNVGHLPKMGLQYSDFLVSGPLCRYATDLLPMMKILTGDKASQLNLNKKVDFSKIKIYYMEDDGGNPLCTPVSKELKTAQKKVLTYFEAAYNVKPKKVDFPQMYYSTEIWLNLMKTIQPLQPTLEMKEKFDLKLELLKWLTGNSEFNLSTILSVIYEFIEGKTPPKEKYIEMERELELEMKDILQNDGIFLYPSFPETAVYHNETFLKMYNIGYMAIFNILGLPVTQCPLGLSSKGLPLGIQVVGGLNQDHLTISVAMELERAFGGWRNPHL